MWLALYNDFSWRGGPSCFLKRKATSLIANMLDNKGILLGSAQNMLIKQDGQREESHWEKPSGTQDPKHVMLVLGFFWTLGSYDLMVIYWNILEIENVYLRPLLKQIPKDTFHDLKVLAFKAFFFSVLPGVGCPFLSAGLMPMHLETLQGLDSCI